jgi:hypothetical protein
VATRPGGGARGGGFQVLGHPGATRRVSEELSPRVGVQGLDLAWG